ncbi:MAG TPA: hypothetical protein VEB23_13735 [Ramlibacter sp.]|nr:hypothetical protein [Ramlibacter sp.]
MFHLTLQFCSLSHSRGCWRGWPVQCHHRQPACIDMNILQTIRLLTLLAFVAASTAVIITTLTTEALELRALTQVGLFRA